MIIKLKQKLTHLIKPIRKETECTLKWQIPIVESSIRIESQQAFSLKTWKKKWSSISEINESGNTTWNGKGTPAHCSPYHSSLCALVFGSWECHVRRLPQCNKQLLGLGFSGFYFKGIEIAFGYQTPDSIAPTNLSQVLQQGMLRNTDKCVSTPCPAASLILIIQWKPQPTLHSSYPESNHAENFWASWSLWADQLIRQHLEPDFLLA